MSDNYTLNRQLLSSKFSYQFRRYLVQISAHLPSVLNVLRTFTQSVAVSYRIVAATAVCVPIHNFCLLVMHCPLSFHSTV